MTHPHIELRVGQVWTPAAGTRAKARTITFLGALIGRSFMPRDTVGFLVAGHPGPAYTNGFVEWTSWMSKSGFLVWARRYGATCVEPVSNAEIIRNLDAAFGGAPDGNQS